MSEKQILQTIASHPEAEAIIGLLQDQYGYSREHAEAEFKRLYTNMRPVHIPALPQLSNSTR